MRKRNQAKFFDNIMWYIVYLFPLLVILFLCLGSNVLGWSFQDWNEFENSDMDLPILNTFYALMDWFGVVDSPTFSILSDIFGVGTSTIDFGLFQISSPVMYYCTYFINCVIVHLFVDFILFIPRLCHKWMASFTQGD